MVRLRVAARIFSEEEFQKNRRAGKVTASPVEGEKRLVVIVRDPYQWQIGTLLLDIQRQYNSCYQRDLPEVKKLRDADDCDINPESYVSDVLLDEGRAQTDPSDQRVTVNVVVERDRSVREGSVTVGSQLENPQYQTQLERTSRPPVPTFPGLASSLGKRPSAVADYQSSPTIETKRARHLEIPEAEAERHGLFSSIEHDEPVESIELVKATQYSNPDLERDGQPNLVKQKDSAPGLRRLSQEIAATDQLEELPGQPLDFMPRQRGQKASAKVQSSPASSKSNRPLQRTVERQKPSQAPITPPSETARRRSRSSSLQRSEDAKRSTAQQLSASASKFKRQDVYDYPELEIDDSQMSPRSKTAQSSHRKPSNRLSRIESLVSPQEDREEDNGLTISQAIESLDNGSVFDDHMPTTQPIKKPKDLLHKANSGAINTSEISIYDDAETQDVPVLPRNDAKIVNAGKSTPASKSRQVDGAKAEGTRATPSHQGAAKTKSSEKKASKTEMGKNSKKRAGILQDNDDNESQVQERQRKRGSDEASDDNDARSIGDGSENGQDPSKKAKGAVSAPKSTKLLKKSRSSTSLDSPGEQLSQSLQQSTSKPSATVLNMKLIDAQKNTHSATPDKKGKQTVKGSSSTKSAPKESDVVPSKKADPAGSAKKMVKKQAITVPSSSPATGIILQPAEGVAVISPTMAKPLPRLGSDVLASTSKASSSSGSKKANLIVAKQDDARKSPSVGVGLTAEELKIMESRKNMTEEEYAANKKRKSSEYKKEQRERDAAARQKPAIDEKSDDKTLNVKETASVTTKLTSSSPAPEKDTGGRFRCSTCSKLLNNGRSLEQHTLSHSKPPTHAASSVASTTSPSPSTETKVHEGLPVEKGPALNLDRRATQASSISSASRPSTKSTSTGNPHSVGRESSGPSSSKVSSADSETQKETPAKAVKRAPGMVPNSTGAKALGSKMSPNTIAKTATKSPSVRSTPASKTPKLPSQQEKPDTATSTMTQKSRVNQNPQPNAKFSGETTSTASQPRKQHTQRLTDLHESIRREHAVVEAPKSTLLSAIKQNAKTSGFQVEDDDDDDDETESSEEEEEVQKPKVMAKVSAELTKTTAPSKQQLSDESEEEDDESSENEQANKKSSKRKVPPPGAKRRGNSLGLPDLSIRDKSVDSDDDVSSDD